MNGCPMGHEPDQMVTRPNGARVCQSCANHYAARRRNGKSPIPAVQRRTLAKVSKNHVPIRN